MDDSEVAAALGRLADKVDDMAQKISTMNGALTERCPAEAKRITWLEVRFWALTAIMLAASVKVIWFPPL
jgi:hypothetical protein